MVIDKSRGFSLLEVVVALAVLTISFLGIARVLGAATVYAAAARRGRLAAEAAVAVGTTLVAGVVYPMGWRPVGAAGADALPGTADDTVGTNSPCRRRITAVAASESDWRWVEVECGTAGVPDSGSLLGARSAVLVRR